MSLSCLSAIKNGRQCNKPKIDTIIMVIDRSGSMFKLKDATLEGVNSFINDQKSLTDNCNFSLITFDNIIEKPILMQNIKNVDVITEHMIKARGSTSLNDAIYNAIIDMDKVNYNGEKTIVIMTDGYENSSKEITKKNLTSLIKSRENKYKFIYLGANQDAVTTAESYGINSNSALTYDASPEFTKAALHCASNSAKRQRSGGESGFTPLERQQSSEISITCPQLIRQNANYSSNSLSPIKNGDLNFLFNTLNDEGFTHFYR